MPAKFPAAAFDPRAVAAGRALVGVSMLTRPALIPAVLRVDPVSRGRMAWAVQMLGAREVALGAGALAARGDRRTWLLAGIVSDAIDAYAVTRAMLRREISPVTGAGLVAIATAATAVQARALVARPAVIE